jgi:hypothetical protein
VLDDVESLLTPEGRWRDAATGSVVTRLCAPEPGRRVVLVCDRPIVGLENATTMAVGALSRSESEWLARECQELAWGELGADHVVRHVGLPWLVCRGSPRLIEYTSAGSPSLAQRRTRAMDKAWEVTSPTPPPVGPRGRPRLGRRHPGAVLTAWATERARALPAPAARLFCVVSSLEPVDRLLSIVQVVWELLESETGDPPEPVDSVLSHLAAAGMVELPDHRCAVHPAIARAGRDLDAALAARTVEVTSVLREHQYESADPHTSSVEVMADSAARCVPYLMRRGQWEEASRRCEEAINHDRSPSMAARLLPFSTEIVRNTTGTDLGRATRYVRYTILLVVNPRAALKALEALHAEATRVGDAAVGLAAASSIAQELHRSQPLRARDWLRRARDHGAEAGIGPWPLLLMQLHETQLLVQLGASSEALAHARSVLADYDRLRGGGIAPAGVDPHALVIAALQAAAAAAHGLGDTVLEQQYRTQSVALATRRSDPVRSVADLQFNQVDQLVRAGKTDEAQAILIAARNHYANPGDEGQLALVLIELAGVEHMAGHGSDAVALARQSLRASYVAEEWLDAARSHQRLATFLSHNPVSQQEAPAHLLAAAVIHLRLAGLLAAFTLQPHLLRAVYLLSLCFAKHPQEPVASLDQLGDVLWRTTQLDLRPFLAATERVPVRIDPPGDIVMTLGGETSGEGEDSVTDVLALARRPPLPMALLDPVTYPEHWEDIVNEVAGRAEAGTGADDLASLVDDLTSCGWDDLAGAIAAIGAGRAAMPGNIEAGTPEHVVVRRILDRLAATRERAVGPA